MVELELEEARESLEKISEELKILLLPKDPNDDRNVIVEIRGGAGGAVLRQPIPDVQHVRGNQAVENGNSQRQ